MRLLRRPVVIAAFACLLLPSPAPAQIEERAIYASVVDGSGAPVTGLTADDFRVREDQFAREVLRAYRATDPMQIALLVDNSTALQPHVGDLRRAVSAFVKEMAGANSIAIVSLASRPTIVVNYTNELPILEAGVGRLFAENNTGATLLDGIAETAAGMVKRNARRPVMVVVTGLGPEMSDQNDHRYVLDHLRRSGATLIALVVTQGGGSRTNLRGREREFTLNMGTSETGGRPEEMGTTSSLEARLTQIAAELTNQYLVVYAHPQTLIPPESIEVSVRRPGLTTRSIPVKAPDK
jgi:VWFA-related protein